MNPSRADIDATRAINQAFAAVGIKLVDNIIIADNKFYSFAENGKLDTSMLNARSVMETSIKDRMIAAREKACIAVSVKHSQTSHLNNVWLLTA